MSIGSNLTAKLGPLPIWQWGALGGLGIGLYYFLTHKATATPSGVIQLTPQPSGTLGGSGDGGTASPPIVTNPPPNTGQCGANQVFVPGLGCVNWPPITAPPSTWNHTCPPGWIAWGGGCLAPQNGIPVITVNGQCPPGYTLQNGVCVNLANQPAQPPNPPLPQTGSGGTSAILETVNNGQSGTPSVLPSQNPVSTQVLTPPACPPGYVYIQGLGCILNPPSHP